MIKALRKRPLDGDFHNPTKTVYKDRQHMGRPVPVSYQGSLRLDGDPAPGAPRPALLPRLQRWAGRENVQARGRCRGGGFLAGCSHLGARGAAHGRGPP